MRNAALAALLSLTAYPAVGDVSLSFPVACKLGDTCFIEDYVDRDASDGTARDHMCGLNTRDGHRGTDIAIIDFDISTNPTDVLAAAPGEVLRTRDRMADDFRMTGVTSDTACGNAVVIQHADDLQTLYCHLKHMSVTVSPGDIVAAGDVLGHIGLSGQTTHPHLHLTVLKGGEMIDPFRPEGENTCNTAAGASLWADTPEYHDTLLRLAGFSDAVPNYDALRAGTARVDSLRPGDPMVVYAEAGLAQDGDTLTITATGPNGEVFTDTRRMTNPRKSQLPAFGKRAPKGGWPTGDYTGQITLRRDGMLIANRWAHVTVKP
mmetsp:Transcript_28934/g.55332  ORF Transcript_28934/g.55332 Transcript_28934/m.55332 type:complete len:320 (+) Transcript_28934:2542-3501(+)